MAISLARFIVYNMDYDIADADGSMSPFPSHLPKPPLTAPRPLVHGRNVHSCHRRLAPVLEGTHHQTHTRYLIQPQQLRLSTSWLRQNDW